MDLEKKKSEKGYETIEIGNYNVCNLKWRVLFEDDEKMLVITENVIEFAEMKQDNYCDEETCVYQKTALRRMLVDMIRQHDYIEEDELKYVIPNEDGDIMFILSSEQIMKYLPNREDRVATELINDLGDGIYDEFFDEFDSDNGVIFEHYESEERYLPYWTSTMSCQEGEGYAEIVYGNGQIEEELCSQICGIRPAMWVKKVK